ncbi:vWA domain-containing protein [Timonella sp. A28]|uniref:vWA domain-containing protein n=1 Tax=Timonella sp. A28 TaxID=3442640 RepID=UPI003EBE33EF
MTVEHTSVELSYPWVIAAFLISAVVAVGVVVFLQKKRAQRALNDESETTIWLANTRYIHQLPEYRKQLRTYRLLQGVGVFSLACALTATSVLVAKPVNVVVQDPRLANRDIVLCLDVSGSMLEYDRELVDVFTTLTENFAGERIALSVFNSTSRLVFPLTDDYALIREQLKEASIALDPNVTTHNPDLIENYLYFTAGANTDLEVGSSLIGDGLANCALLFEESGLDAQQAAEKNAEKDKDAEESKDNDERSKSIIFATDNDLQGESVYSLKEAVELASSMNISLIGLYGAGGGELEDEQEYRKVFSQAKDSMYFYSDDPEMINSIVTDVQNRQAVLHDATPIISRHNIVGPWFFVLLASLVVFFAVQRRLSE